MPKKAEKRLYGYIRCSTKYQNENRQRDALLKYGVLERDLFIDRCSGKDFHRPEYERMLKTIVENDEVVILDLDRLGRNYNEISVEWYRISKEKKCDITIINCPDLSTTATDDRQTLTKQVFIDIMFTLLSYIAEQERRDINRRRQEGVEAAMNRGVKFGRPAIKQPEDFSNIFQRVLRHEITNRQAMEQLGLKPCTYYRFVREEKARMEYNAVSK